MPLLTDIIVLFHIRSLYRLRKLLLKKYPHAIVAAKNNAPFGFSLFGWPYPKWYYEMELLHYHVLFSPQKLPVEIFADDKVFSLTKKIRKSFAAVIYAWAMGLILINLN